MGYFTFSIVILLDIIIVISPNIVTIINIYWSTYFKIFQFICKYIVSQSMFMAFFLFLILDKTAKYNHTDTHITKYKHLSVDIDF